jgi:hypothetical protein
MKNKKCGCEKDVFACRTHAHPKPKWIAEQKKEIDTLNKLRDNGEWEKSMQVRAHTDAVECRRIRNHLEGI